MCEWSGDAFGPIGPAQRKAVCPNCSSLERHRALYLFLRDRTPVLNAPGRLLHFAPEACMRSFLEQAENLDYVTTDLERTDVDVRMDIQSILFRDDVFDWVICSHVLEHVPSDTEALAEIARVLRPGGTAFVMVPILDRPHGRTHDDPMISEPEARLQFYGQEDHVRAYSHDFAERVRDRGYSVDAIPFSHQLGQDSIERWGLNPAEQIFVCTPEQEPLPRASEPPPTARPAAREVAATPIETISPRDAMARPERLEHYFEVGRGALGIINRALETAGAPAPQRILDLPSGYGRVLRMLRAEFPEAEIVASDVDHQAMEFCEATFGVRTASASPNPAELSIPGEFDLIWCGSLATHLSGASVQALLRKFAGLLSAQGVLIFTTHGAEMDDLLTRGAVQPPLARGGVERMRAAYATYNFGFEPYVSSADRSYGFSLCNELWVRATVEVTPGLELAEFTASAWDGRQDATVCRAAKR